MIDDILLAALGAAKTAGSVLEAELRKLEENGKLSHEDVVAIAKEARAALEARALEARKRAGPILDAAKDALHRALGVPSKDELRALQEKLDRALAALEKAEAERRPQKETPPPGAK